MSYHISLKKLVQSDMIKTKKVCGFFDKIDEDSKPQIMYCGKIQKFDKNYVKLDSGIFIRRKYRFACDRQTCAICPRFMGD